MSFRAQDWAWGVAELPPTHRLVLLALADHHNKDTGRCDPTVARLVTRTGLCERAVRGALQALHARGVITITHRGGRRSAYGLSIGITSAAHAGVQDMQGCRAYTTPLHPVQRTPAPAAPGTRKEPGREPDLRSEGGAASTREPGAIFWSTAVADLSALLLEPEANVRPKVGNLLRTAGNDPAVVLSAIERAKEKRPAEPFSWLMAAVKPRQASKPKATPTPAELPSELNGCRVPVVIDRVLDALGVGDGRYPDLPRVVVDLLHEGHEPDALYAAATAIARQGVDHMRSAALLASIVRKHRNHRGALPQGGKPDAAAPPRSWV